MPHDLGPAELHSPEEQLIIAQRQARMYELIARAFATHMVRTDPRIAHTAREFRIEGERLEAPELTAGAVMIEEHMNIKQQILRSLAGASFDNVSDERLVRHG